MPLKFMVIWEIAGWKTFRLGLFIILLFEKHFIRIKHTYTPIYTP